MIGVTSSPLRRCPARFSGTRRNSMTHPMAVEERQDDEALGELDGDESAGPLLAAIQHSYEEAKACIDGLARSPLPATPDGTEPHPGTEKIDLRLVTLPAVPPASAPPTAAMSLAARVVAEQPVSGGVGHQERVARAGQDSPGHAVTPRRRRATVAAVISRWFPGSAAHAGGG
jgi:hypothetical protein